MLSVEMLMLQVEAATLPYLAEVFWSWTREKRKRQGGTKQHRQKTGGLK
jgi:hypothetical protein